MSPTLVIDKLRLDKRTGASSDTLLTGGALYLCQPVVGGRATIEDRGPYYEVLPRHPITEERIASATDFTLIEPLVTGKQAEKFPGLKGFDLDEQRAKQKDYGEQRKKLPPALRRPLAALRTEEEGFEGLQRIAGYKPHPELPVYSAINAFKVADSFNAPILAWQALPLPVQREVVALLFQTFAKSPNDLDWLHEQLADLHRRHNLAIPLYRPRLQIINPDAGKGANSEKGRGVNLGNLDELWPLTLLKLVGYRHLAVPLPIRAGDRIDYKTYVLRPRRISRGFIDTVIPKYRDVLWSTTAIKADILAALRFVQVLVVQKQKRVGIEQSTEEDVEELPFLAARVTEIAEGFDVTLSKSFANAMATMNLSVIGLPTWLPDMTGESLTTAADVLGEHVTVIEAIGARAPGERKENETSEEVTLLQWYRDFLSTGRIDTFLDLTAAYAPYLMSQSYRQRYVALFSMPNLEELMKGTKPHDYTEIVYSQGFRTLAYCIRESTINVQMYKNNTKDKYKDRARRAALYEVRYGLSHDLSLAAKEDGSFIAELHGFVQSYCAENARVYERLQGQYAGREIPAILLRKRPDENDLAEVVALVQRYGAGVVCKMLLAFGYARSSRTRADEEPNLPDDADTPVAIEALDGDTVAAGNA